jgi:hypothetical protein
MKGADSPPYHFPIRARSATNTPPLSSASCRSCIPSRLHRFARVEKQLKPDDYVLLAHSFEEICAIVLRNLIPEALLFDAIALDLYRDRLDWDMRMAVPWICQPGL